MDRDIGEGIDEGVGVDVDSAYGAVVVEGEMWSPGGKEDAGKQSGQMETRRDDATDSRFQQVG